MSIVPQLLASGVTAAVVGGLSSWLVARETRKATIQQAETAAGAVVAEAKIGAEVEHAKRRDSRRDRALPHLVEADELMSIIGLSEADERVRKEAATRAHTEVVKAAVILTDTFDAKDLKELLAELRGGGLDRAANIWPDVRQAIIDGRIA